MTERTLVRAAPLPSSSGADGRMLFGHFAVTNRWTEIDSYIEGRFLERFAAGAFRDTIATDRSSMRCLFQHGRDPSVGDKPLGPIQTLREDAVGGYYEVPLLDVAYAHEIEAGLRAGVYGASFRFQALHEEINENPGPSPANPRALPERTVIEARLFEFGPVTFPAYSDATATVRSLTDWYHSGTVGTRR